LTDLNGYAKKSTPNGGPARHQLEGPPLACAAVGHLRQHVFANTPHGQYYVWLPMLHWYCGSAYLTPLPPATA